MSITRSINCALALLPLATLVGVTACQQDPRTKAREMLTAELSSVVSEQLDSVVVTVDSSRVLRGVRYYWGASPSRQKSDSFAGAVVAAANERFFVVRSLDDWLRAARRSQWVPTTPEEILQSCEESLRLAGARRDPVGKPTMIRSRLKAGFDVQSIQDSTPDIPPTVVEGGPGDWTARFWAAELGQATHYQCSLSPWTDLEIVTLDSIVGAGFPDVRGAWGGVHSAGH